MRFLVVVVMRGDEEGDDGGAHPDVAVEAGAGRLRPVLRVAVPVARRARAWSAGSNRRPMCVDAALGSRQYRRDGLVPERSLRRRLLHSFFDRARGGQAVHRELTISTPSSVPLSSFGANSLEIMHFSGSTPVNSSRDEGGAREGIPQNLRNSL
jgi:hypothetical protein